MTGKLFNEPGIGESAEYLSQQLITYIGNKRALLQPIESAVQKVYEQLGRRKLRTFDGFTGSGVVARLFKQYSSLVVINDLEKYANIIGDCYLTNSDDVDIVELQSLMVKMNNEAERSPIKDGIFRRLYSPIDESEIKTGERVFYTPKNAERLDTYRTLLNDVDLKYWPFILGPLLSKASIHVNTAGVFKGFYKDSNTGRGKFGGSASNALQRIRGEINLQVPVFSNFSSDKLIMNGDIRSVASQVEKIDLAYFDPPYNQHPYGSNYFMLNLLVDYVEPSTVSKVSGIPLDWNRSDLNKKQLAFEALRSSLSSIEARFLLVSYNSEGFITPEEMRKMLDELGTFEEVQLQYNTYRGSRNLAKRDTYVTEHLFLVDKQRKVNNVKKR
jgi:adenine-specific DNA-methyltransferase